MLKGAIPQPNLNCYNRFVAPLQITPREVKHRLDAGEKLRLVDVREPHEFYQAHIEGSELIPMRTVIQALPSLETEEAPLIVFCHHGMRSLQVVQWLRQQGVENCSSMEGGIDRLEYRRRSFDTALRMMKFYLKPT
jgi:rhodanese-related sulfurtransferase